MATIRWMNPDEQMYPGEPIESVEFTFHFDSTDEQPGAEWRIAFDFLPERPGDVAPASSADGASLNAPREIDAKACSRD